MSCTAAQRRRRRRWWRGEEGERRPGPEGQFLRHVLWHAQRNALPHVLRRVLHGLVPHVPVLHASTKGKRGMVPPLTDHSPSSAAPSTPSATSCAASFTCSSLTCSSFTCHLGAYVAWVQPLADGKIKTFTIWQMTMGKIITFRMNTFSRRPACLPPRPAPSPSRASFTCYQRAGVGACGCCQVLHCVVQKAQHALRPILRGAWVPPLEDDACHDEHLQQ